LSTSISSSCYTAESVLVAVDKTITSDVKQVSECNTDFGVEACCFGGSKRVLALFENAVLFYK
jgi:hypothetical protein